ncbi:MAG TPA: aminotransferase class III-fold pyridoxal phosphate-dependent enzyme [Herpetosiphonaceae bacterium]
MSIQARYHELHPRSAELYAEALNHFPSGVTHDRRYMQPFPVAIDYAEGGYKWDVDGNRLLDYWQGHGALLLGHSHPALITAVQQQIERGAHYGANHALEVRWAEAIKTCFPHIERLRFTASGTESTLLALRLARAYTRKPLIIRFTGHFHGWHDLLAQDAADQVLPGVLEALNSGLLVLSPSLPALEQTLAARDDIAAVVLEPSGASYGTQPMPDDFLRQVRRLTAERNILLICDEVVTGFRVAPGGVQERAGVQADLTALAKIVAGGLPGGTVGGRAEILEQIAFGDADWNASRKIIHQGTFNANPLSAAAGIAMLEIARTGEPQRQASEQAARLIAGLNDVLRRHKLAGCAAYGDASIVHLVLRAQPPFPPGELPADLPVFELKSGGEPRFTALFRMALLNHGVDLMRGKSAFVSAAHTADDIDRTVAAFEAALHEVIAELDG